jgi:hypothetical protein
LAGPVCGDKKFLVCMYAFLDGKSPVQIQELLVKRKTVYSRLLPLRA